MGNEDKQPEVDILDNNYPLISRLRDKAPGTFQHCTNVKDLLVAVGSDLGNLDMFVLKALGMLHDQGKTKQPEFFTENQMAPMGNPHDELEPWVSHRIICAHVDATAEILVNDPNVPRFVVQCCTQHHGTTVMRYFKDKAEALAEETGQEINPDEYRYKGTKPQSFEAALLMICDVAEAACRSKGQAGTLEREDIPGFVETLFRNLDDDGQFDEVHMGERGLGDLRRAREIISQAIQNQHHKRVDYDKAKEAKKDGEAEGKKP